ncbi:alkaline phosphatase D family protein [Nocardia harenae]|uniref:alkaline phosphatase D family protein n=1 Tax=Nocardia harenae TaxID=358707 RepID=UPI000830A2B1|nr:alkaline phosphatase D family protein [Nocardia harenae]
MKGGAVAAAAVIAGAARATAETPVFGHGVASGDPLPTGVILWTRVTPAPDATPGSTRGPDVAVRWEVARDDSFTEVVADGTATATAASDHTVKIDAAGLAPGTDYRYRFTALGATSPIGSTRTAPAAADTPERLRFGVVSCSNWEAGYFGAYRHLAARGDLDAVLHLGDYLYEYERGEFGGRGGAVRAHDPEHEIVTLADYRIRHGQYKTDPDLALLHGSVPFIATWDDHETANDAWSGGAENHDPAAEGEWAARYAAARQAYREWMPVRDSADGRLYRRLRFGALAELSMLDLRSYRDRQASPGAGWRDIDAPERSITGREQLDWLIGGLESAPVRWKLVGNPVMIAPVLFPPLDPAVTAGLARVVGIPAGGIPVNADQWDGYTADRNRLVRAVHDAGVGGVLFLTGDIHSSWAADLPLEAAAYPAGPVAGAEFVVPSVTSQSPGDLAGTGTGAAASAVREVNRHLRYLELDSHGYGVLHVDAGQAQMDWFYLLDVKDPNSGVRHGISLAVGAAGRIEQRPGPVG